MVGIFQLNVGLNTGIHVCSDVCQRNQHDQDNSFLFILGEGKGVVLMYHPSTIYVHYAYD